MFSPTPATPFVDDLTTITAATANAWRRDIARAIDGTAGGTYTPSVAVTIAGAGLSAIVASGSTFDLQAGATYTRRTAETLVGASATTAWRTSTTADATPATYDVTYDEYRVPESITAGGGLAVYTLRHSTAPIPAAGNRIRFSRNGAAFAGIARFVREDGTILASMAGTGPSFTEFCYMATVGDATARWRAVAWGGDVTIGTVA